MKRFFSFFLGLVGLLNLVNAQAEMQATDEKSLLWEISGNELQSPSYLYGTIHMIPSEDFFLTAKTMAAFDEVEKVVFEINMEDMSDMSKMMPLMMKAFMKGDTTLQDLLSEADYGMVKGHFESIGLPMFMLERIKPMFLSVMASGEGMDLSDPGSVKSYEMEFTQMAQQQEKTIDGLETAEYQMSMFDSIPYRVQADMLVEAIKTGDTGDDQFQELVKMYQDQDIDAMYKAMEGEKGMADYEDLLLFNRNRNWIPVMAKMMQEGTIFFAVGAGHLGGPQGVVNLLREQGYQLKPLK